MAIKELLDEFISISDKMRCGYKDSLGAPIQTWKQTMSTISQTIPTIYQEIYSRFAGTHRGLNDQRYMDFIPGYRLIHIDELVDEYHNLLRMMALDNICEAQIESVIPLLADYASCYVCYAKRKDAAEAVFLYSPNDGLVERHHSIEKFFETAIQFYKENVYFLDSRGFLDYDFEKEAIVGKKCNPGVQYWFE